jgi:transcription antitermination factor NusG
MATIVDSAIAASNKPVAGRSLQGILSGLRGIKQPEEIALISKAAAISCDGHNDVMRAVKPGMTEYQAQAIMEYHFKKNGSEYPGYPSIVGAAENACVLHYVTNLKLMNDGDVRRILKDETLDEHIETKRLKFAIGESIIVKEGAFSSFEGSVSQIHGEKVDVDILIFGRRTPVTLSIDQIKKI